MKFISAGHCTTPGPNYDPGASGVDGRKEAIETVKMRDAVVSRLRGLGDTNIVTDLNNESLRQYLKRIKTGNASMVCEFHFNAFDGKSSGVEVLVQEDADKMDIACAKDLAFFTAHTLELPLRGTNNGVKKESESHHSRLGLMREQGIVVLVEICFIDNAKDMTKYDNNFNILARGYADILYKYDALIQ